MNRSLLSKLLFSFVAVAALALPAQAQETPAPSATVANIEAAIGDMQAAKNRAVVAGDQAEVDRLNGIITRLRANLDQVRNQEAFDATKQNLRDQMQEASAAGLTDQVNEIAKSMENVNELERSANEHRTDAANADSRDARDTAGATSGGGSGGTNTNNQPATTRNNDPYGMNRSRVGEKVVEGLFGVGTALLQSWLNGGQSDEERAAMDRIFAGSDAAAADANPANPGTPIYGPNGEIIGYDRNEDGKVDSTDTNDDGTPDSFAGGTYEDDYSSYSDPSEFAYDDYANVDTSDAFIPPPVGNSTGGGASSGDTGGASLGGDTAGSSDSEDEAEDEEAEDEEEKKDEDDADAKDADLADADSEGATRSKKTGDDDGIDAEVKDFVGRIFILPKDAITNASATGGAVGAYGNQAPKGGNDGFSNDGWNDSDNGDWADEEDDWGWEEDEWGSEPKAAAPAAPAEPGVPAMGTPLTPEEELLKQEIIQVEAEIAKWQKAEREKKLQQEDPYAFESTRALQAEAEDPFKAYRNEDGRLDLTRVNVWIVVDDSWKEPTSADPAAPADPMAPAAEAYSPTRMRLIVPDELLDRFEPIQGGWVSLRGTPVEAEFNPAVFPGLKGTVQDLDLVQVLAVTKEQPADLENTEYSDY
ncbi:MAG: hypothetical protein R3F62_04980 [Planctomycetota bacterium]